MGVTYAKEDFNNEAYSNSNELTSCDMTYNRPEASQSLDIPNTSSSTPLSQLDDFENNCCKCSRKLNLESDVRILPCRKHRICGPKSKRNCSIVLFSRRSLVCPVPGCGIAINIRDPQDLAIDKKFAQRKESVKPGKPAQPVKPSKSIKSSKVFYSINFDLNMLYVTRGWKYSNCYNQSQS